jgi:uncharacterized protein YdeI (YjbR/CyaY-like superfamily)
MHEEESERSIFFPSDRRSWREWLIKNANNSEGVWVIIQKKNSDISGITYEEAVEEAVAFGWIDSKAKTVDTNSFKQLFTPRKAGSIWSKSNKNRVEKLKREGLMTKTALDKIEEAKKDGSWYKLNKIEEIQIPSDLKKMLRSNDMAVKNFEAYTDSLKKQIIWWIESAKREETRKKRIKSAVKMAEENRKRITIS